MFVGIRRKSGEMWVAAKNGEVVKTRAVRRLPVEERWTEECVDWVRHTPWNKFKGDPDADGEIPQERKVEPQGRETVEEGDGAEDLMKKKYVVSY